MAEKFNYEDLDAVQVEADKAFNENRHVDAEKWYANVFRLATKKYGFMHVDMLPIYQRWATTSLNTSDADNYRKQAVKCMRAMLAITEREHGLDAPELVPILTQLVQFYDLDGAHMLAIEVKQRIDDLNDRLAALKS
jgi:hypothetical protein